MSEQLENYKKTLELRKVMFFSFFNYLHKDCKIYNYEFMWMDDDITLTCPIHGEVNTTPQESLEVGCIKCHLSKSIKYL
jgi:hypothetical protein